MRDVQPSTASQPKTRLPGTVRVVLVDDHALVRAGIRALLEAVPGMVVVAEADDGREGLALVRKHRPDLVLTDLSMGNLDGIHFTAQMTREMPEIRVLVLSIHSNEEFVARALVAGAQGYLVKDAAPGELTVAVETLMRDERYVSPRIARSVLAPPSPANPGQRASPAPAAAPSWAPPQCDFGSLPPAEPPAMSGPPMPPRTGVPTWGVVACYFVICAGILASLRDLIGA